MRREMPLKGQAFKALYCLVLLLQNTYYVHATHALGAWGLKKRNTQNDPGATPHQPILQFAIHSIDYGQLPFFGYFFQT